MLLNFPVMYEGPLHYLEHSLGQTLLGLFQGPRKDRKCSISSLGQSLRAAVLVLTASFPEHSQHASIVRLSHQRQLLIDLFFRCIYLKGRAPKRERPKNRNRPGQSQTPMKVGGSLHPGLPRGFRNPTIGHPQLLAKTRLWGSSIPQDQPLSIFQVWAILKVFFFFKTVLLCFCNSDFSGLSVTDLATQGRQASSKQESPSPG